MHPHVFSFVLTNFELLLVVNLRLICASLTGTGLKTRIEYNKVAEHKESKCTLFTFLLKHTRYTHSKLCVFNKVIPETFKVQCVGFETTLHLSYSYFIQKIGAAYHISGYNLLAVVSLLAQLAVQLR